MCTCSWAISEKKYEIWFSRDEDKQRPIGLAPEKNTSGKNSCINPVDPVAGGTWIFTNHHGLSACLLNHYDAPTEGLEPAEESRGQLLSALMTSSTLAEFQTGLFEQLRSTRFAPCRLFAISKNEGASIWTWDGHEIFSAGRQEKIGMLTSSSWNSKEVLPVRQRCFDEMVKKQPNSRNFAKFHLSTAPEGPAYSVCMDRPNTRTVSLSHVICDPEMTQFTYKDRALDGQFGMPEVFELALKSSKK